MSIWPKTNSGWLVLEGFAVIALIISAWVLYEVAGEGEPEISAEQMVYEDRCRITCLPFEYLEAAESYCLCDITKIYKPPLSGEITN